MAKPTVAITGANGFLGDALVKHFSNKGWRVIALVRQASAHKNTGQVTYRNYDITKPVDDDMLSGTDYLVHAAYIKRDKKHPNAMQLNIVGAKQLLQAARNQNTKKNVFISSMSAHEGAESAYGKQKLAIEKLFNTKQDLALRPGLIIGNGGIVKSMAEFMQTKHMVPLIGGGKQPIQIVSINDLVLATDKALGSNQSGVLTIATSEIYTYKQFYKQLQKRLATRVVFVPVPFGLLMAMMKMMNALHLPLSVGEDSLLGLKNLRSADTAGDLKKLGLKLDSLEASLNKTTYK